MGKHVERWCDIELFSYEEVSGVCHYTDWLTFYGVEWKIPSMQQYDGVDINYNPRTGEIGVDASFYKKFLVKDIVLGVSGEHAVSMDLLSIVDFKTGDDVRKYMAEMELFIQANTSKPRLWILARCQKDEVLTLESDFDGLPVGLIALEDNDLRPQIKYKANVGYVDNSALGYIKTLYDGDGPLRLLTLDEWTSEKCFRESERFVG